MKISLKRPIEHEGATYSTLTIREAELGDLCAMEDVKGGELSIFAALLARLTGVPEAVIMKITASDLRTIQKQAGPLLGNEDEGGAE